MSRDKLLLLFGLVTYGIGQSLLYVVFGPLARDIGLTEFQFGVLVASSNIAIVIFSPMWGRASQAKGRKPIFIIGLMGYAIGYAMLAFGIQAGLWTMLVATPLFWALLGARLVYGVVASAISPAATAYVADTTNEGDRAAGMALVAASSGIGTIFGPFLGGVLAQIGPVVPMYAASLLAIVAAILSALKLKEPVKHADAKQDAAVSVFDGRIFPYLFGWFVIFMVFTAVQVITAFYIEDQFLITDSAEVIKVASIALFIMAIVTLLTQVAIMTVWKLPPKVLLRTSFFIYAAVLMIFAYSDSLIALYLCFAGLGFSVALAIPGLNAAASLAVEAHEQGAVAGWLSSAPAFGMIFGPALGGYVYEYSPNLTMIIGALLSAGVGVMFWLTRIPEPKPAES